MSGRITSCWVVLLLVLTSVSAARRRLNSINDLKSIGFGKSVPMHSLVLLHWFANAVDIDESNVIHLTFGPNSGTYGSHHYGNFDELLDPLPRGYQYYTLGNINQGASLQLPHHVVHPRPEYEERNRARIIIRIREPNMGRQGSQIIDQVYITQHFEAFHHQEYDPRNTYQVTTNLLREIRQFSLARHDMSTLMSLQNNFGGNATNSQLEHIRNTWDHLACLGLLLFIVGQNRYYFNQQSRHHAATGRNEQDLWSNIQDCVSFLCRLLFCLVVFFVVVLLIAAASKQ